MRAPYNLGSIYVGVPYFRKPPIYRFEVLKRCERVLKIFEGLEAEGGAAKVLQAPHLRRVPQRQTLHQRARLPQTSRHQRPPRLFPTLLVGGVEACTLFGNCDGPVGSGAHCN